MRSKLVNGPPGPSVDSLIAGPCSITGRCCGGDTVVAAVVLDRVDVSGGTVVGPRADVSSEGRRFLVPSLRLFRLTMVLTNCFSSRSERVGTILIIVLASSRGCGGFDRPLVGPESFAHFFRLLRQQLFLYGAFCL